MPLALKQPVVWMLLVRQLTTSALHSWPRSTVASLRLVLTLIRKTQRPVLRLKAMSPRPLQPLHLELPS
jgi:hypothetical protein